MKELAIGEKIHIRCVEGIVQCKDCVLGGNHYTYCAELCCPDYRTDHKDVHFELVETTEPSALTRLTTNQKIDIIDSFYTCQDKWVAKRTIEMMEERLNEIE